jgi:predicted permease
MLFTVAATLLTAVVFGLIPAVQAGGVDLIEALKATGRGSIHGRSAFTGGIVALEISLSFMLLVAAGLLMTSALRMGSEPLGFNPDRVIATRIDLPSSYSTPSVRSGFYDRLIRTLERVPGASAVALASRLPPDTGSNNVLEIPGRQTMPGAQVHDVSAEAVSPAFFQTLTIPILRGRPFNEHDGLDSAPVAIVNEALVREYFPHTDPLGNQVRISASMPWLNIVGVSGNIKHTELMNEMQWHETPFLYRPVSQDPRPSVEVAIRTSGNNAGLEPAIANAIAWFDVSIPKTEVEPLSAHLARILAYPRFRAVVLAFFALTALLLSAIGLHGVLSQTVAGRTREFGVRRAVGAQTRDVIMLVARQGSFPVLTGLAAGLSGVLAFSSVLSSLLYGIEPANPAALAAISVVLLIVSVIAMGLPARRAARVDPMVALRDE